MSTRQDRQDSTKSEAVAWFTAHALNELYTAGDEGCCPACCGPCAQLWKLADAGLLDDMVRPYCAEVSYGTAWWRGGPDGFVSVDWLNGQLSAGRVNCPNHELAGTEVPR